MLSNWMFCQVSYKRFASWSLVGTYTAGSISFINKWVCNEAHSCSRAYIAYADPRWWFSRSKLGDGSNYCSSHDPSRLFRICRRAAGRFDRYYHGTGAGCRAVGDCQKILFLLFSTLRIPSVYSLIFASMLFVRVYSYPEILRRCNISSYSTNHIQLSLHAHIFHVLRLQFKTIWVGRWG